jgi:hypothetical protein
MEFKFFRHAIIWFLMFFSGHVLAGESKNVSFQFIDSNGVEISEDKVPVDLRMALIRIPEKEYKSLVLARVKLPIDEKNKEFSSTLVGENWHGGMHYLSVGGRYTNMRLREPICIGLTDFSGSVFLEVKKAGYKVVRLPVPNEYARMAVVWMGEIPLEKSTKFTVVKGKVLDESGSLLKAKGQVELRVNGTTRSTLKVPLESGAFSFDNISPGEYLVEFNVYNHSVDTLWLTVPEDVGPSLVSEHVAHPIRK